MQCAFWLYIIPLNSILKKSINGTKNYCPHAMNALDSFHPAVAAWFSRTFDAPTPAQERAWPALKAGQHVLVAAPTGSGKAFAAFLAPTYHAAKRGQDRPRPHRARSGYVSSL